MSMGVSVSYSPHPLNPPLLKERGRFLKGWCPLNPFDKQVWKGVAWGGRICLKG